MGQGQHRQGHKSGGCNKADPGRERESGHHGFRSSGLFSCRLDADSWTATPRGAPKTIDRKVAETKATTNAEPSTEAESKTDHHIGTASGYDIGADIDQTLENSPATKPKETG